jgi:CHAT domain-containing protein
MAEAGGPWAAREDVALSLPPLHRLYEALVQPLAGVLPGATPLVVVPDGPLFDLPFGLLVEAPAESYTDAAFLIRRRPVSVEMAAALVTERVPESHRGRALVAFGRSQFGGAPRQWRGPGGEPLADLPNVAREIERVGDHAGGARLAMNEAATEDRLGDWLDDARVVHLASHATSDAASPPLSRIFLWNDPDADDDGVLHLYELQARHLQADLIVLSGCSTAKGQAQPGEGTLSLQYGVRAAGAQAALATLWPVDDRAMADVMDDFYGGLAEGLPKDRALQRAQVAYLDSHDGLDASPFFWASLVLSGNAEPVDLGRSWTLWIVAADVALAAALAWWLARRRHARRPAAAL